MENKIETDSDEERSKKNEYEHPILLEPFDNLENPVFDSEGNVRDKSEEEINKGIVSRKPVIIIESADLRKIQSDYRRKKDEQFEKIMNQLNEMRLENRELKQEITGLKDRINVLEETNRNLVSENKILRNAQIPSLRVVNQHNKRVRHDEIYGSDNEDGMQNVPLMDKNSESRSRDIGTGLRDTFSIFSPREYLTQEKYENELRRAAYRNDIPRLKRILINNKDIVNGRGMPDSLCSVVNSFYDKTALMLAAKEGHFECVKELLKNGASVNLWDRDGHTALDYAHRNRHREVYRLLTEHRALLSTEMPELNKGNVYKLN